MFFCPRCANLLIILQDSQLGFHLCCQTCLYKQIFDEQIRKKTSLTLKRVDEIRGGKKEWEAVPKTSVICENCGHNEAYFKTRQMRSMDEPETITFRCCECANVWILDR